MSANRKTRGGVSFACASPVRTTVRHAAMIRTVSEPWPPIPRSLVGVWVPRITLAAGFAGVLYLVAFMIGAAS
jgi:hypothetical protein